MVAVVTLYKRSYFNDIHRPVHLFCTFVLQLSPDGGKYLASVILNNKVLQHLYLNHCGLYDEGAFPIADGEFGMEIGFLYIYSQCVWYMN